MKLKNLLQLTLMPIFSLIVMGCPTRLESFPDGSADSKNGDSGGKHTGADARSDGIPDGEMGSTDGSSAGSVDATSACGGFGQSCCPGNICSLAGGVCGTTSACECPIGSHVCRSTSCIANSSLCDIVEYPISGTAPQPVGLALGPDDNIWFADTRNLKVGRMTAMGSVIEYAVSDPPETIVAGPDGKLWFTEQGHPSGGLDQIGTIDTTGSRLDEFDVSGDALSTDPGNTLGGGTVIIAGPDQNLWFTESVPGKIGRMTTSGVHTAFQVRAFYPEGIVVGPDNNIWYALLDGAAIGRLTTSGMGNTEIPFPTTADDPQYLTVGPDNNFWIVESTSNLISRYNPSTGDITPYRIPTPGSVPGPIVLGPDGNLWTIGLVSNNIVRISAAGVVTEFPLPNANSHPTWIVKGPQIAGSGTLWISERGTGKIARVIP